MCIYRCLYLFIFNVMYNLTGPGPGPTGPGLTAGLYWPRPGPTGLGPTGPGPTPARVPGPTRPGAHPGPN